MRGTGLTLLPLARLPAPACFSAASIVTEGALMRLQPFHKPRKVQPDRYRPRLEVLEDRLTPSVTVTTTADVVNAGDGVTSLREAISLVNAGSVADNTVIVPAGI